MKFKKKFVAERSFAARKFIKRRENTDENGDD